MKLSLILPTYLRCDDLKRLLESISNLQEPFFEVLVIIGPNDTQSQDICEGFMAKIPNLKFYHSTRPSVITSVNFGLSLAKGDILCLTDDDSVLPPTYTTSIITHFEKEEMLGAFGGRDRIQYDDKPEISNPPLCKNVGVFLWFGRLIGNHHCGSIHQSVEVDVLKGVNMSFRRSAFPIMEIDPILINTGAEPAYEIDICQYIQKMGYKILYENDHFVYHFGSPRVGADERDYVSSKTAFRIFNDAYVYGKYRPFVEVLGNMYIVTFIGSRITPGIFRAILLLASRKISFHVFKYSIYQVKYYVKGLIAGLKKRRFIKKQILAKG